MTPGQLEIPLHARRSDPATSHLAARIARDSAVLQRSKIILSLRSDGPAAAFQLDDRLGWAWSTANRRMKELEDKGKVRRTGRTEPTPRGGRAEVWEAV